MFSTILKNLQQSGMIERDDIYYLWGHEIFQHILPYKDYMIKILVHLDVIIAPKTRFEDVSRQIQHTSRFLVPSMITKGNNTDFLKKFWRSNNSILLTYTFIEEVIPPALSYRFLSSFITSWEIKNYKERNTETKMLFSDLAVIQIDSCHDAAVQVQGKRLIVSLIHAKIKDDIIPTLASSLQECLTAAVVRISEFYSMLSKDANSQENHPVMPFDIEFGVFCGSNLCFFNHKKKPSTTDEPIWVCNEHKQRHSVKCLSVWFSDKVIK